MMWLLSRQKLYCVDIKLIIIINSDHPQTITITYSNEVSGLISKSNSPRLHFTGVYLIFLFLSLEFLVKEAGEATFKVLKNG